MKNKYQKSIIYDEVKNCIKRIGLPIKNEVSHEDMSGIETEIRRGKSFPIPIRVLHISNANILLIGALLPYGIPANKRKIVGELIELINVQSNEETITYEPSQGLVSVLDTIQVEDDDIDINHFIFLFKDTIRKGKRHFPLICEQVYSDHKPKYLLKESAKELKRSKDKIRKRKKGSKSSEYPFIIHADPLIEDSIYPTHTHGLHDIGWPEFFIDPLAFGPDGNGDRINSAYHYFNQSKSQLEDVLKGNIIEIPINILNPKWGNAPLYSMCFRIVSHNFDGLKLAYDIDGSGIDPDMKFVQIWVKGDDYAIRDEYYTGGIIF